MGSEKKIIAVVIVFGFFVVAGVLAMQYMKDSKTVQKAIVVRAFFVNFCMENGGYPTQEEFDQKFPKLAADPKWLYRPSEDLMEGAFQYPMTLPVPLAPGESKYAESMPVIDSYSVTNPCKVFTKELL